MSDHGRSSLTRHITGENNERVPGSGMEPAKLASPDEMQGVPAMKRNPFKLPRSKAGMRRLAIQALEDCSIFAWEADDIELAKAADRILRKIERESRIKNKS